MDTTIATLTGKRLFSAAQLSARQREALWAALEIGVIVLWAMILAAPYLNTSTYLWPAGNGLGAKLMGHHFWTMLRQCGLCALWDGAQNGGRPALADVYGSQLHPLVMVTTLLWGVTGGLKIAIVGTMALVGIAQWWIARLLKLGRVPAVWSACIAVGGGHLMSLNDEGQFGLMLATASGTLALAALLGLALNRRRQDTIVLAVVGALMLVSGQGYMHFALLFWAPAVLLLWQRWDNGRSFVREVLLALGLAVLLAGVLIVPTAHFWPNLVKDNADPNFGFAPLLEYIPLNLVIRDMTFYGYGEVLGKMPHNELQFVGWVPVLLALLSVRYVRRDNFGPWGFFALGFFLTIFFGSAIPLRVLAPWLPFLYSIRYPSVTMGFMVPAVLALAAFGLHAVLKLHIPKLELSLAGQGNTPSLSFQLKWLLVIPLVVALQHIHGFSQNFIFVRDMTEAYVGMTAFTTPTAQWVSPPPGEVDFTEPAIYSGLKVTSLFYPAVLAGREAPAPYLVADRNGPPPDSELTGSYLEVPVYRQPQAEYAFVQHEDGRVSPCQATSQGGSISVACAALEPGVLVVRENAFPGWQLRRDGERGRQTLLGGTWLSAMAPAGEHVYRFVYRPWDVAVGALLSLVGAVLCVALWRQQRPARPLVVQPVAPAAPREKVPAAA